MLGTVHAYPKGIKVLNHDQFNNTDKDKKNLVSYL